MKKILICSLFLVTFLEALDFDSFLQRALRENSNLQVADLDIRITKEQGKRLIRYENPSLGIEYGRFDPDIGKNENGYSFGITQPIRLWGVEDDKKKFAKSMIEGSSIAYSQKRALLVYEISVAYIKYAKQRMFTELSREEEVISKKIYEITKSRFNAGNASKKELLQAKTVLSSSAVNTHKEYLQELQSYYELLKVSGIYEDISIETDHKFRLLKSKNKSIDLLYLQAQKQKESAKADLESINSEYIELNANYEKEPEQDISTIGLSIPFALFNRKNEEKNIAKLKLKQIDRLIDRQRRYYSLRLRRLKREREELLILRDRQKDIIKTKERLLGMLESGYRVSKSNLLELNDVKKSLIESKKNLINARSSLNLNIIRTNYMQGAYND